MANLPSQSEKNSLLLNLLSGISIIKGFRANENCKFISPELQYEKKNDEISFFYRLFLFNFAFYNIKVLLNDIYDTIKNEELNYEINKIKYFKFIYSILFYSILFYSILFYSILFYKSLTYKSRKNWIAITCDNFCNRSVSFQHLLYNILEDNKINRKRYLGFSFKL